MLPGCHAHASRKLSREVSDRGDGGGSGPPRATRTARARPELDFSKTYTQKLRQPAASESKKTPTWWKTVSCGMSLCPYPGIHAGSIDLGANFCSARPQRSGTTSSSVPCMIKTLEDTFAIFSWFTKMSMGLNLCGNRPVRRVLRRAVRNRHRHAIVQASHRWREGHDLISTQAATRATTRSPART